MTRHIPLALVAVLGALLTFREPPLPAPPVAPVPARPEPGRGAELDALRQQLTRLAAEIDNLSSAQVALEEQVAEAPVVAPPMAPRPTDAELDADTDRVRAAFAATLAGEPRDAAWSGPAEVALEDRVRDLGDTVRQVHAIECRSTMCRVELQYDPMSVDPNALADALGRLAPWPANTFYEVDTGDDPRAFVYFGREGVSLPRPG